MQLLNETFVYLTFIRRILPEVSRELANWKNKASQIRHARLRAEALASLKHKRFHCVGGSVLALLNPTNVPQLVRAIVTVQTISDYLDNLVDRGPGAVPTLSDPSPEKAEGQFKAFMHLHEAMLCALDPERAVCDYYSLYCDLVPGEDGSCLMPVSGPRRRPIDDGGYLDGLVQASRSALGDLSGYSAAKPLVLKLARLYSELQSIKHLSPGIRDKLMLSWFDARLAEALYPDRSLTQWPVSWRLAGQPSRDVPFQLTPFQDTPSQSMSSQGSLTWWEFGAAAGSTLGMFSLVCSSGRADFTDKEAYSIYRAYFPQITALHILLDYFIDQEEDRAGGDLNFVTYYGSHEKALPALCTFARRSLESAGDLQVNPHLHRAVVRGLLAMYLSDPKIRKQGSAKLAKKLLAAGGPWARPLCAACALVRKLESF